MDEKPDEPDLDALLNVVFVVICGVAFLAPLVLFPFSFVLGFCDNATRSIRINIGAQLVAGLLAAAAAVRKSVGLALASLAVSIGTFAILFTTAANCSG